MSTTTALIGRRKSDRARVWVTIELRTMSGAGFQTVEHADAPAEVQELSVTGAVRYPQSRHRDIDEGGQLNLDPADIEPAEGWTRQDVESLAALWQRWHLNTMKAACAHMELPEATDYDSRKHIVCPVTGYRYGQAWLTELLPADVVTEVQRLQALPTGEVPNYLH